MFYTRFYEKAAKKLTWNYTTAITQFILFLTLFIIVSYLSMLIHPTDDEDKDGSTDFVAKYQKYIVLSVSLYMIIPFTLSVVLIVALITKSKNLLFLWVKSSLYVHGFIVCFIFANGIFIAVKGINYIGYTLIGLSIILFCFMTHSILLTYQLVIMDDTKTKTLDETDSDDNNTI